MLVSIIVPVYNVEKYLRECLESILKQTYKELDVILIDDGSQDNSGRICDEYAKKYNIFKVIHKKNEGLGRARNTGLDFISGNYVIFLDSDDYIDSDYVEVLMNKLIDQSVDMCKSGFKRVDNSGQIFDTIDYHNEIFEGKKACKELLPRMIGSRPDKKDSLEMAVCGAIYNVKPIKEYGLRFPSERELISEDLVFNIDYMQYANGAITISYTGYNYRLNVGSLTTQYRSDRFEASCFFYQEMKKKLENLNYDEITMLRLSRMFFIYIRMCIAQENTKISKLAKKEGITNIKKICKNSLVKEVIDNYPVKKMGIKQQVFLILVRNNAARILSLFAQLSVL